MKKALPTLYKRTELGQIQVWTMHVDGNKFYSIEGIQGGTMTTNKPTVCAGKNIGRANETSPEEQATKEAQAKWKKKTESGYSTDVGKVDDAMAYFEPMLCHSYDDYKDRVTEALAKKEAVYVQPKLDGMRCIARKDGLWSRNGKPIVSVPHIHAALKPIFDKYPKAVLDGELYCDKLKNNFNQIMHLCRQSKPTEEDLAESARTIQYWIYDFPSCQHSFGERSKQLRATMGELIMASTGFLPLHFVETVEVATQAAMDKLYEKWMADGMEGQIIRLDAPYEQKRSRNILKRKEFKTEEYIIGGIEEGVGNRAGTAGFMILNLKDGRTFKSNIKGPYTLLTKIWINRENYIGKSATCKFFCLTPDGVPRFPYVIDVAREDFE